MCIKSLVTSHFIGFQEKLDFEEVKIIHITAIVLNNANDKSIQVFKGFLQWTVIQHFVTVHPEKGVQSIDGSFIKRSDQKRFHVTKLILMKLQEWQTVGWPVNPNVYMFFGRYFNTNRFVDCLKYAYFICTCSRSSKGLLVHALK